MAARAWLLEGATPSLSLKRDYATAAQSWQRSLEPGARGARRDGPRDLSACAKCSPPTIGKALQGCKCTRALRKQCAGGTGISWYAVQTPSGKAKKFEARGLVGGQRTVISPLI